MEELFQSQHLLRNHIQTRLLDQTGICRFVGNKQDVVGTAAVLFLLGMHRPGPDRPVEPCLIFNERSRHVRQPGDLCFPGGGLSPRMDGFLAGVLRFPGLPLYRWAPDSRWHSRRPVTFPEMPMLLATSLRESFEEMRINPFRIRFLGPMAPVNFTRFDRIIYPMVAWNLGQKTFFPNWEVARIVYIPLRRFFRSEAYASLPATLVSGTQGEKDTALNETFPCLTYDNGENREILWGLTYRIVVRFLDIVFDFKPPDSVSLPEISKQ